MVMAMEMGLLDACSCTLIKTGSAAAALNVAPAVAAARMAGTPACCTKQHGQNCSQVRKISAQPQSARRQTAETGCVVSAADGSGLSTLV
eukprot:3006531-Amphidinium_carterae.3